MPLKSGKSQKTVSKNIKELVSGYKSSGSIGSSKPQSKKAAVKQAVAISLNKAGIQKKAKGGEIMQTSAVKGSQAPRSVVASQEANIKRRGGKVGFKRDGNLPVGMY
jgi:hypothetical protein